MRFGSKVKFPLLSEPFAELSSPASKFMTRMRLAASLLALCAAPWASAFTASAPPRVHRIAAVRALACWRLTDSGGQLLRRAPTSLSTRRPVAAAASRLRAVATSPEGEEKSAGPRGSMEPADFQTPKEKGRERLLQIQNGAFALGSVLIAVACIGHVLRTGEDPVRAVPFSSHRGGAT